MVAPVGSRLVGSQLPDGVEGLSILNASLMNEVNQLHAELAFFIQSSTNELQSVNDEQEAARAAGLKMMERVTFKVNDNHRKTKEVAGLKVALEKSVKEKDEVLLNFNKLNVKFSFLEEENGHLKLEMKEKEIMINELSQKLEAIQPQENVRGTWSWLIPLTTVIVVAGTLVYAAC